MLGLLNLRRHPFVTTGARDAATLGIGVVGFVIAGPMSCFSRKVPRVSLVLGCGVADCVLWLCVSPSGSIDETATGGLQRFVGRVATDLEQDCVGVDPKSRWIGDALVIPQLKIHMHLEAVEWLRNVQMLAGGNQQSMEGWLRLERELKQHMEKVAVGPNIMGIPFIIASAALAITVASYLIMDTEAVKVAWDNFFRR